MKPASRIIGVQFGLFTSEEIRKNSVAEITSRETYTNNKPVLGGLMDPRMSVSEPGQICPTDGLTYIDNPGYFGHVELSRPVFFIQHIKEIVKIIRSICFKCSHCLIDKEKHLHVFKKNNKDRNNYVYTLSSKVKRCGDKNKDGCGCIQPDKIKIESMATIIAVWNNIETRDDNDVAEKKKINIKLTPEIVLKILKRISDDDITFMGYSPIFSRPECMICEVLPVPPPCVRPSVKHDAQQRSEDDLTHIYSNIIKTNNDLKKKIEDNADPMIIEGLTTVLQYFVAMIADNKVKGAAPMAQRSGRPLNCITKRINHKDGRIRWNLMGKRVDFSARSVITGDPNLSILQLGVPLKIAKNITKPVIVNDLNRDFLMKLVQNGPLEYPGAKILEKKNGENISLRYVDIHSIKLENNDIVHRHIMDGDIILFNRQPTLHKMSMMALVAKVMKKGDTFRFNVAITKPFNADFDGDEMNAHFSQNVTAETELRHLAAVPFQIISPASNSPIIGIFQDNLLGCYRFTREEILFTPLEAMNLLMKYPHIDVTQLRKKNITNFEILSQILPSMTTRFKTKLYEDDENFVTSNNVLEINNGKYERGQIEKSVMGAGTKGLIHRINNDFGPMEAVRFIDNIQNIITTYIKNSAFSVGVSDLIANKKTYDEIITIIFKQTLEVQKVIDKVHNGIFENNTGNSNMIEFENSVKNELNKATDQAGKVGRKSLNKNNRFMMIVNSGSKGSLINISQMICCLGQQNIDGKRVPYGFDSRTLPHYCKYDDGPEARGFIKNSYISGLTAPEMFFHAMAGRIGLIDTAVKSVTWETPIFIIENGKPLYTEIGKWIDSKIDHKLSNVTFYTEQNMEYLELEDKVYISTTNDDGIVSWGEMTAVTRHDPGDKLYEITTSGGRSVTVTASKSLIIWKPELNKFIETPTPEIKVGDFMPVSMNLPETPITKDYVDMSEYLPKTEYIYGTDFNIAKEMLENTEPPSRKEAVKFWVDWWNENNNNTFTLPYISKKTFARACRESKNENIKDGLIYVYGSTRKEYLIPERFELNEENGRFIGLFLADGNTHNGTVCITKNNEAVKTFVKDWFDRYQIHYSVRVQNRPTNTSTTITGNCSMLAKFINEFVGFGSYNKFVPTEAFVAPLEFKKGIISGYISGDGHVTESSIIASSVSKRLIEGMAMLGNSLGMFCKISEIITRDTISYKMSYRGLWGTIFANNIELIENDKNDKLKIIKCTAKHMNFDSHNDCVKDKIVSIKEIGIEDHPKMYDVTVPSTLNFGIFNGMLLRDTSSTGYIQRRLIKGMEDLKVEYDMTVRNSKGKIVQFSFGDDNFDPIKVETQFLPFVTMSLEDIYIFYDMNIADIEYYTKGTITRINKQKELLKKKNELYIKEMILNRNEVVEKIYNFKNENSVRLPVAFQSIINNIQGQFKLNRNSVVDITPLEAFELFESYFEKLNQYHFAKPTKLFKILYFYYLNPRELLINKRFNNSSLIVLLEIIVLKFKQALVNPGEMVGIVAGQSIGEPTTQMTLNSVVYETEILVRNSNKEIKKISIGDFTTEVIKTSPKIDYMEDKDMTYAPCKDFYEVPCATEEGLTVWRRIEAATKHPVVNKDGTNTMLKVTTKGNREVIATKAKSFLQLIDGKIQGVNGWELNVGDYLPVSKKQLDFKKNFLLNLKCILSPSIYTYGSELEKAKLFIHEHRWWHKHANKDFILPHGRSDSVLVCIKKDIIKDNFVYMKNCILGCELPEIIELNYDFGYLVGAYAAEGCMTKFQVSIANNDLNYLVPIIRWCNKHNITTKIYKTENKNKKGWTVRIYNTLLCRILENLCGKLSHNKFVSDKIVFSNRECMLGFLDAYIGGDGYVRQKSISITSVSKNMLMDVYVMLKNLNIYSVIHKPTKIETNNRGSLNIKQHYELFITNKQGQKLASLLNIKIKQKQEKINKLLTETFRHEYTNYFLTVPNKINGEIIFEKRSERYCDVEFDQIISIEEVQNTTEYAYDLTVEETRNFDIYNGVCAKDTFHSSGTGKVSLQGVPRIDELIRLTENPKKPSIVVFLKPFDETSRDKATKYANILEHTRLVDVVSNVKIYFDPIENETSIEDDKLLLQQYFEFEKIIEEYQETVPKSKWIIRLEFDQETLLDKNITMDDIHFSVKNSHYGNDVTCIYSDYNMDNLVFRIRINNHVFTKGKKKTESLDQSDEIYLLKNFQDGLLNNIVLRGIHGLKNVLPRKLQNMIVEEDGNYIKKDIWVLDTDGTNLLETLSMNFIDYKRTYSSDVREMFDIFGIEATRQILYNEFVEVFENSDNYINYHHLGLLCDRMTCTKNLTAIFRSGLLNDDIGPISKATFEVHSEVLLNASRYAELDIMRGVSANVMMGQEGIYGTNSFQLVLDITKMNKLNEATEVSVVQETDIEQEFGFITENEQEQFYCSKDHIEIDNNIENIKTIQYEEKTDFDDDYDMGF
jgi:DNA-directed RNA polymerase beta' subunit